MAVVAVAVVAGALGFISHFLNRDSGFFPKPTVVGIADPIEAKEILVGHAGIYATRLADGEMLLELRPDGTWGYYDMFRGLPGYYKIVPVQSGTSRPVMEDGRLALLTDKRFLFYPEGDESLVFLKRLFNRVGKTRDDLPYFIFSGSGEAETSR